MKGFEDLGKEFNFRTTTMETNIPRARFNQTNGNAVWLKAEEIRNIMQVGDNRFQLFFSNSTPAINGGVPAYNTHYVEVTASVDEINDFWGMKS